MKKHLFLLLYVLCPILVVSQNIGIGTASPAAKLTIKGNYSDPLIPGSTSNGILRIGPAGNEGLDIGKKFNGAFDTWLQAGFNGAADPISLNPLGGNVGIGLLSPSAKLEVEGGIKADSLDVQSGLIKNLADPISAQDVATKAYVDILKSTIDSLESKLAVLMNFLNLTVQQRLDSGETPLEIYNSDNSLLDSLYGKWYQGGYIAYLNTSTGTGLVTAPNDQGGNLWGCSNTEIGGTSSLIGTGQANTTLIINGCGASAIAASLCDDYVYGGYDDWFLPSKDELNQLYVNLKLNDIGSLSSDVYWSSTEYNDNQAWDQYFIGGNQYVDNKENGNYFSIRAVRAF